MSTMPMSEVQSPMCAPTHYLARISCPNCGDEFEPKRTNQRYCTRQCQMHATRDGRAAMRQRLLNIALAHLNRDRYIGFDGQYEGPLNKSCTLVVKLRKDHGYHSMPVDVHVKPVEPKFSQVTPNDVDWAQRQSAFPHTLAMPRPLKSFCVSCAEMVIDAAAHSVRVTYGVYLPINHVCARLRVYDLRGNLLEVKNV